MGTKQRRQLRNYLIHRRVQLTITAAMVALTSLLTALLGAFWYTEIRSSSEMIRINAISTLGPEAAAELGAGMAAADQRRLLVLVGFGLVMALLICAYGIVTSHRFAGPLVKVTKHMRDVAAGRLYSLWGLRRRDQLKDLFAAFDQMHGALRQRTQDDLALLEDLLAAAEKEGALAEHLPRLRETMEEKIAALRDASETTRQIKVKN